MITKFSIRKSNDSFAEALRLLAAYKGDNILFWLNRICETECSSDLEKSYYMGIMFYVQYPRRAKMMFAAINKKNETIGEI